MHLALDKATGDLIFGETGGVVRVSEGRFVVQQVRCKLRTWLGEWALNPTVGWVSVEDFEKNFDLFSIENRARRIILNTKGVLTILSLELDFSKRKLTLGFQAKTIYGIIEDTVPWG